MSPLEAGARWRAAHHELLGHLDALTDGPMTWLGFVWLALLVVDLTRGLTPNLQLVGNIIWVLFGLDFLLSFAVAPNKRASLKSDGLTLVSLLLPAAHLLRATRSLTLLRIVTSLNRGFRSLASVVRRRGVGYVALLSLIVVLVGAAGMRHGEAARGRGGRA